MNEMILSTHPGKVARWTATTATWEYRNRKQKEILLEIELGEEMDYKMINSILKSITKLATLPS